MQGNKRASEGLAVDRSAKRFRGRADQHSAPLSDTDTNGNGTPPLETSSDAQYRVPCEVKATTGFREVSRFATPLTTTLLSSPPLPLSLSHHKTTRGTGASLHVSSESLLQSTNSPLASNSLSLAAATPSLSSSMVAAPEQDSRKRTPKEVWTDYCAQAYDQNVNIFFDLADATPHHRDMIRIMSCEFALLSPLLLELLPQLVGVLLSSSSSHAPYTFKVSLLYPPQLTTRLCDMSFCQSLRFFLLLSSLCSDFKLCCGKHSWHCQANTGAH